MNFKRLASVLVFTLVICSSIALAQSGAGSIQGTVQDSTGAMIPGASIRVVNQATGIAISSASNSAGFYSVPSLFAGNYTLTFSAKGMQQYQTSISLQAAQTATISPKLSLGSVTQKIVVPGNAIQLATYDNGTISSELDSQMINHLPMNGRELVTLTQLTTPGLEGGGARANGNMDAALEYVQDGAPLTNRNFGGEGQSGNSAQAQLPDPDAVQEVRIETTDSSAQFATPATAIITTKSGTDQLHGSFFETARNNAFGIAKDRQDPSNYAAPHLVRNEFGASIGGPIVIPKLYNGKGRSFFFFAYERYSLRSYTSGLATVPTQAMRNGDFSGLVNSAGVPQVLYDPNTSQPATSATPYQRTPFQDNQIPLNRISPLAKTLFAITPLPTNAANPLVASNYTAPEINNATIPTTTFRLDHVFNENNRIYLRYTDNLENQLALSDAPAPASIAGGGLPAGTTNLAVTLVTTFSGAIGYTHVFSPTFFSETVLGNQWFSQHIDGSPTPISNYETMLGLPNNFGEEGFPQITGGLTPYYGTQSNYNESQIITNIDENLTKIIGRHQLQFGARYRHERFGQFPGRTPDQITFDGEATGDLDPSSGGNYTALPNTGNANADMFLGAAANYSVDLSPPYAHYRDMEFDTYFQDNFHVSKALTINYGLRWEVHPATYTKDGLTESFDMKNDAIVMAKPMSFYINKGYTTQTIFTNLVNLGAKYETPQMAGIPNTMFFNDDFTFSPRIGVAYTPFGGGHGTVLRAGYGRYIYAIPLRNELVSESADLPFERSYSQSYEAANQSPDGLPSYLLRAPQAVVAGMNSATVVNSGQIDSILPGIGLQTDNPHFPPNYVTQVNATIEQPLKGGAALRVSYIYDHGQNLDQYFMYNQHPSNYVWEVRTGTLPPTGTYSATATGPYNQTLLGKGVVQTNRNGYSNDNALQLNYQRLYRGGYSYQIFYVFSRAERVGGNYFRDGVIYPAADYAPGILPTTDPKALNHFENNIIDSAIPEHHIQFNGIVDLPVGRGKRFFGNVNRFVNELIGGYQIAGDGQVLSQQFQPNAGNWGPTNPIHLYKAHKITDCRSGVCRKEDLWFNGYIAPTSINAATNGVSGLPSDYVPYQTPINNTPGTTNYSNNNVPVTLNNGNVVQVAYSPGPSGANPYSHTFIHGPFNYNADLSLFKVFPITDRVNLRVNVDAFNAFNIQGNNNPNSSDGTESFLSSYWTPRQVQFTAKLTF